MWSFPTGRHKINSNCFSALHSQNKFSIIFICIKSSMIYLQLLEQQMNLLKQSSNEERADNVVVFKNGHFFFKGHQLPYEEQSLSPDRLFLTDLCLDLPVAEWIKDFDHYSFNYKMVKMLISDLESLTPQMGLMIMQQLPPLSEKNYCNVIMRLSLNKIKKIFMHNGFYQHLWKNLYKLQSNKKGTESEGLLLPFDELNQPFKRLLYMIEYLPTSGELRQALTSTVYSLIDEILKLQNFLSRLINSSQTLNSSRKQLSKSFLSNLITAFRTLLAIPKCPLDIYEKYSIFKDQRFESQLFNEQCLEYIKYNFDDFFNFDRANLMTVLGLIASQKGEVLWQEVIGKKYIAKQEDEGANDDEESMESVSIEKITFGKQQTNQKNFIAMIISTVYNKENWDKSLMILQNLVEQNPQACESILIKIFLEVIDIEMNCELVQLVIQFIPQVCSRKGQYDAQIGIFLTEFLLEINNYIDIEFQKWKPFEGRIRKKKVNSKYIISFLKIYSIYFQHQLTEILAETQSYSALKNIALLTQGRQGIIKGARQSFFKKKEFYEIGNDMLSRLSREDPKPKTTEEFEILGKKKRRRAELQQTIKNLK